MKVKVSPWYKKASPRLSVFVAWLLLVGIMLVVIDATFRVHGL